MYLDGSNHNGVVLTVPGDTRHAIVFVHTETCPYCVQTKPVFEEFCRLYSSQFACYMVDVGDERGRAFLDKQRLRVDSVPKFLKYVGGYLTSSELRERTVEGMRQFMMMM